MKQLEMVGVCLASLLAVNVLTRAQTPSQARAATPAASSSASSVASPQQPPPGGGGQPPSMGNLVFNPPQGLPTQRTVHITGENPGLQLRETANGPIVADFNFWRVHWSPVGTGHACYLTTGDGTKPGDLRLLLTDNEKLANYVTHDTMAKLVPTFATPPYKVVKATFSWDGDTLNERRELCTSNEYKVVATWRKIAVGRFGGMTDGSFFMNFIIHMATEGEITVNGKKLPGTVLPGPGRPPSYLAFAETWLK